MNTRDLVRIRAASTIKMRAPSGLTTDWTYTKGTPAAQMVREVGASLDLTVLPSADLDHPLDILRAAREEWLRVNDPQDGTDCVTPYDRFLYR